MQNRMLTWFPYCHAMSCMKDQHLKLDDFVPDFYKKEQYQARYASIHYHFNGETLWKKPDVVDLQPSPIKMQPGRLEKKKEKKLYINGER